MQNLELKASCKDKKTFKKIKTLALSIGATFQTTLTQKDTYFFTKDNRLKIREWNDTKNNNATELIGYQRSNTSSSRISKYFIYPVEKPKELINLLTQTLGVQIIVEKKRDLYAYGVTRIHLDHVKNLGYFVELETVFPPKVSAKDKKGLEKEHMYIINSLQLHQLEPISTSYSALLKT